jgi:hypothetical protein
MPTSASEYAAIASAVYARGDNDEIKRKITSESNGKYNGNDYTILESAEDYVVIKKGDGSIIIGCRGTSGADDIVPDFFIALGILHLHPRAKKIFAVVHRYSALSGGVTVTGHSLGGKLAALAAVNENVLAVTFNQGSSPIDSNHAITKVQEKLFGYNFNNIIHFTTTWDGASTSEALLGSSHTIHVPPPSRVNFVTNHYLTAFDGVDLDNEQYTNLIQEEGDRAIRDKRELDPRKSVERTYYDTKAAVTAYNSLTELRKSMPERAAEFDNMERYLDAEFERYNINPADMENYLDADFDRYNYNTPDVDADSQAIVDAILADAEEDVSGIYPPGLREPREFGENPSFNGTPPELEGDAEGIPPEFEAAPEPFEPTFDGAPPEFTPRWMDPGGNITQEYLDSQEFRDRVLPPELGEKPSYEGLDENGDIEGMPPEFEAAQFEPTFDGAPSEFTPKWMDPESRVSQSYLERADEAMIEGEMDDAEIMRNITRDVSPDLMTPEQILIRLRQNVEALEGVSDVTKQRYLLQIKKVERVRSVSGVLESLGMPSLANTLRSGYNRVLGLKGAAVNKMPAWMKGPKMGKVGYAFGKVLETGMWIGMIAFAGYDVYNAVVQRSEIKALEAQLYAPELSQYQFKIRRQLQIARGRKSVLDLEAGVHVGQLIMGTLATLAFPEFAPFVWVAIGAEQISEIPIEANGAEIERKQYLEEYYGSAENPNIWTYLNKRDDYEARYNENNNEFGGVVDWVGWVLGQMQFELKAFTARMPMQERYWLGMAGRHFYNDVDNILHGENPGLDDHRYEELSNVMATNSKTAWRQGLVLLANMPSQYTVMNNLDDYKVITNFGTSVFANKPPTTIQEYRDVERYIGKKKRDMSQKQSHVDRYMGSGGNPQGDKETKEDFTNRVEAWTREQVKRESLSASDAQGRLFEEAGRGDSAYWHSRGGIPGTYVNTTGKGVRMCIPGTRKRVLEVVDSDPPKTKRNIFSAY